MPHWHDGLVYRDVEQVLLAAVGLIDKAKALDAKQARSGRAAVASNTTLLLQGALGQYLRDLERIEKEIGALAQQAMRARFKDSRRRDHSGIKGQGETLLANLFAGPAKIAGRSVGSVGVGNVDRMDRVTNPLALTPAGKKPYWRAQEYGSRHLVGKQLRGMFYDTGGVNPTRPGAATGQPIFLTNAAIRAWGADPGDSARGGRATMLVRNPIRPKGFIKAGVKAAIGPWNAELAAAEKRFLDTVRPIVSPSVRGRTRR